MNVWIALLLLGLSGVLGRSIQNDEEEKWMIPQADGTFVWMTEKEAYLTATQLDDDEQLESGIVYYLYTKINPTEPQILLPGDTLALGMSNFNANNPTRVIIHGWVGDTSSNMNKLIQPFVNEKGQDNNVIFVDWSYKAMTINYPSARLRVRTVGKEIAQFLDMLYSFGGMSFAKLTLVGHSLGTHVAGFAGKNVKRGRVNTIIGLDPAMPLFRLNKPNERLNATDAEYVETIHTNGRWLGFFHPIGQAAFYPNWGKTQPGCEGDISGYCSHARCINFYAEAIELGEQNRFIPAQCDEYDELKKKNCNRAVAGIRMYDPKNFGKAKGIYFLPTNEDVPYGQGHVFNS